MKLLRISLRTQMLLVGLTAVDLVVVRATWGSKHHVLEGITLTVLALNAGVLLLLHTRGRARAFLVGFLLASLLAAGSFAWALSYPKASATFLDQATGRQVTVHSSGAPLSDEWESYLNLVEDSIDSLPDDWNPFLHGELAGFLADACIAFIPQVTVALVGGLLLWLVTLVTGAAIRSFRRRSPVASRRIEGIAP
ncbi:MAG: hypothetical protein ACLQIB_06305 [Isosphaeraceae bacterium]